MWDPSESDDAHNIAYLDDNSVHIWDLNTAQVVFSFISSIIHFIFFFNCFTHFSGD